MNNGRNDRWRSLNDRWLRFHRHSPTADDGSAFPNAIHSPYLNLPTTSLPVDVENNRSSEEIEDLEIENDGQELRNAEEWIRDTTAESSYGTAGQYLDDAEDTTQATYLLETQPRSPRRPYLGRTRAPNPPCLLSRYRVTVGAPSPLKDPDAEPRGSPRRRRRPEDIPNDEVHLVATNQRSHIVRPVSGCSLGQSHHPPCNRRPTLNRSIRQGSSPPPASRTIQGVPILEPHFAVGNYNLRPRGTSSTSSGSGRGHRRESFSRTADSDGLFEDTEVESQSRKRRRAGPRRCPASASTSVPGPRSHPTLLHEDQQVRSDLGRRPSVDPMDVDDGRRWNSGATQPSHASHVTIQTNESRTLSSLSSSLTRNPLKIVYLAELIPRRFRGPILQLLRIHAPYIPTVIVRSISMGHRPSKPICRPVWSAPLGPDGHGWPASSVPLEVFDVIAADLSRDDLLNLRSVNREFEKKVSGRVFRAVVVPFDPDIYAMSSDNTVKIALPASKGKGRKKDNGKGKGKEMAINEEQVVSENNRSYDGMQIFKGWGPHIKQFAMSFEVDEAAMESPPPKGLYQTHTTFWGTYQWANPNYSRYASCEKMEEIADETRVMTEALSTMVSATELGLSLDGGLGWLQGPDISDRAQLFKQPTKIFNTQYPSPSDAEKFALQAWNLVKMHSYDCQRATFTTVLLSDPNATKPKVGWGVSHPRYVYPALIFQGVDAEEPILVTMQQLAQDDQDARTSNPFSSAPLIPNALTEGQLEWLLENEWAQRAFLSSFCVSLIDNTATFQHVRTINIAKLSSRYLSELKREDLWSAFPHLKKLVLAVSPDWRDIVKESTGVVTDPAIAPSMAASQFHSLLDTCIKHCRNITSLDLGWVGGGERAGGIFARNKNILPAPLLDFGIEAISIDLRCDIVKLPHVQELTLRNCWIHPPALKQFVKAMQNLSLRTLKLDSVSLCAVPGQFTTVPAIQPILGAMQATFVQGPQSVRVIHAQNVTVVVPAHPGYFVPALLPDAPLPEAPLGGHVSRVDNEAPHEPPLSSCLKADPRDGSWPEVIDTLTPGRTLDHHRYLHGVFEDQQQDSPKSRDVGRLRRIEFVSCGYIRLTNMKNLDQDPICLPMSNPPQCLRLRAHYLKTVMMANEPDQLLGSIAPAMAKRESDVLQLAWGMRMGWEDDDLSKYENREDGQPVGGSGRFSGVVEKEEDGAVHG